MAATGASNEARARVLLSTISTAAVTAILACRLQPSRLPADDDRRPIERLASIREAYLAALTDEALNWFAERSDQSRAIPKLPKFSQFLELAKSMTAIAPADCAGRTRLLILQPTPFCNIDCEYCYLPARSDRHRMPFDIVESAVRFVFEKGWLHPTSRSCGTPASRSCCRWIGTGRRLRRLPVARRQERACHIRCRPTACWWTMNGAVSSGTRRFVWA